MPEPTMAELDLWALALWPTCGGYVRLGSVTRGLVRNAARHGRRECAEAWQKGYDAGEECALTAEQDHHECAENPYPDPDPCVMRSDRPHVCLRADHDERHGKTTPRQPA